MEQDSPIYARIKRRVHSNQNESDIQGYNDAHEEENDGDNSSISPSVINDVNQSVSPYRNVPKEMSREEIIQMVDLAEKRAVESRKLNEVGKILPSPKPYVPTTLQPLDNSINSSPNAYPIKTSPTVVHPEVDISPRNNESRSPSSISIGLPRVYIPEKYAKLLTENKGSSIPASSNISAQENTQGGNKAKSKPLYLRILDKAELEAKQEEYQRNMDYEKWKKENGKARVTQQEIREHAKKLDDHQRPGPKNNTMSSNGKNSRKNLPNNDEINRRLFEEESNTNINTNISTNGGGPSAPPASTGSSSYRSKSYRRIQMEKQEQQAVKRKEEEDKKMAWLRRKDYHPTGMTAMASEESTSAIHDNRMTGKEDSNVIVPDHNNNKQPISSKMTSKERRNVSISSKVEEAEYFYGSDGDEKGLEGDDELEELPRSHAHNPSIGNQHARRNRQSRRVAHIRSNIDGSHNQAGSNKKQVRFGNHNNASDEELSRKTSPRSPGNAGNMHYDSNPYPSNKAVRSSVTSPIRISNSEIPSASDFLFSPAMKHLDQVMRHDGSSLSRQIEDHSPSAAKNIYNIAGQADLASSPTTSDSNSQNTIFERGSKWIQLILKHDKEEELHLAEIYEQGFQMMMEEHGLLSSPSGSR